MKTNFLSKLGNAEGDTMFFLLKNRSVEFLERAFVKCSLSHIQTQTSFAKKILSGFWGKDHGVRI